MALVVEYHEELEASLLPEYDLLDFWRGTLSARRLELLLRNLDPSSPLVVALNPDAARLASWKASDYLLADFYDLFAAANFKNPQPYPRPADVIAKRNQTNARHAALIERYEARQRAQQEGTATNG